MDKYVIEGGNRLEGKIIVSGNKNEALPAIAAALLTDESVILKNVPDILDVRNMLEILSELGADIHKESPNSYNICCRNIKTTKLNYELVASLRASILFAGPLLSRFGKINLPPPGGDLIGRRRLDSHFSGLEKLGAKINLNKNIFELTTNNLIGNEILLEEQSVTATENILMASVLANGKTIIKNAACEPHVKGLSNMLCSMGADIKGIGTNTLIIEGVEKLSAVEYNIGSDFIEASSYIALAAVTKSDVVVDGINPEDFNMIKNVFGKLGIEFTFENNKAIVRQNQNLEIKENITKDILKIDDGTWPSFPSDLMSIAIVAATQCKGTCLFFEKMYDGRMFFVDHLISMGARIILCDPHRILIVGPNELSGTRLQSPDIRAGMSLVIAALCAKGTSNIFNIKQIDRGYENLENKLQSIGAKIFRKTE